MRAISKSVTILFQDRRCEILFWYSIAKTDFVEAIPAEYCSHYGDFVYNTSSCVDHSIVQHQESQLHWAPNKYSLCSTHSLKTESIHCHRQPYARPYCSFYQVQYSNTRKKKKEAMFYVKTAPICHFPLWQITYGTTSQTSNPAFS